MSKHIYKVDVNEDALDFITRYFPEETCFFDIETTGFSSSNTSVYLIGMAFLKDDVWTMVQWFADTKDEEKDIILSFVNAVKEFKLLVSYNGLGFDTNYINGKCESYGIESPLNTIQQLDIYKRIRIYNNFFKLEHLKQKNIEEFLGINRDDKYSGKELISQYLAYSKSNSEELKENLLLHNHDDIKGMMMITPILSYAYFFEGNFGVTQIKQIDHGQATDKDESEIVFEFAMKVPVPVRISYGYGPLYLTVNGNTARLLIKMYKGELKYFYKNYKDYYYLPKEDEAIHKSVSFYVDKEFRTKANAKNCYSKRTGRFLPQYEEIVDPYFKVDYNDKNTFFELTDDLIKDKALMAKYIHHIIDRLVKKQV